MEKTNSKILDELTKVGKTPKPVRLDAFSSLQAKVVSEIQRKGGILEMKELYTVGKRPAISLSIKKLERQGIVNKIVNPNRKTNRDSRYLIRLNEVPEELQDLLTVWSTFSNDSNIKSEN